MRIDASDFMRGLKAWLVPVQAGHAAIRAPKERRAGEPALNCGCVDGGKVSDDDVLNRGIGLRVV